MGQPQERDPTSKKENEIGPIIPDMMMQSTSHQYGHPTNVTPRDGNPSEERIQLEGGATLNGVKPNDVLCGRGKESFNHAGNKRFRETITNSLESYSKADSRMEKSLVVLSIFDNIRSRGGRFLKKDGSTGQWYELSEQQTKEKIAHAVRDAVNSSEARRSAKKTSSSSISDPRLKSSPSPNPASGGALSDSASMPYPSSSLGAAHDESAMGQPTNNQHRVAVDGSSSSQFYNNFDQATRDIRQQMMNRIPINQANVSFGTMQHPFGGPANPMMQLGMIRNNASGMIPESSGLDLSGFVQNNSATSSSGSILLGHESEGHMSIASSSQRSNNQNNLASMYGQPRRSSYTHGQPTTSLTTALYGAQRRRSDGQSMLMNRLQQQLQSQNQELDSAAEDAFLDQINEVLGPLEAQNDPTSQEESNMDTSGN